MGYVQIKKLWSYACNGELKSLRKYYQDYGELNRRYYLYDKENSLLMGAFRNNQYETAEYLLSVGERPTKEEQTRIREELKRIEIMNKIIELCDENDGQGLQHEMALDSHKKLFLNRKPIKLRFVNGRECEVNTWKDVVQLVLEDCISTEDKLNRVRSLCGKIKGRYKIILDNNSEYMSRPMKIYDEIYMETKYSADVLISVMQRILDEAGYDYSEIYVNYRDW